MKRAQSAGLGAREKSPEMRPESSPDAPRTRAGKIRLRSLDGLDGRTAAARRARELVSSLESDLGGDLSVAQRLLVARAAMLAVMAEDAEVRWLERKPADLSLYGMIVDRQRRLLEALGLGRVARDVSPAATDMTDRALEMLRTAP